MKYTITLSCRMCSRVIGLWDNDTSEEPEATLIPTGKVEELIEEHRDKCAFYGPRLRDHQART